jgi:hypothetical protein
MSRSNARVRKMGDEAEERRLEYSLGASLPTETPIILSNDLIYPYLDKALCGRYALHCLHIRRYGGVHRMIARRYSSCRVVRLGIIRVLWRAYDSSWLSKLEWGLYLGYWRLLMRYRALLLKFSGETEFYRRIII